MVYRWIIAAIWLALIVFWAVSARYAKRNVGARPVWGHIGLRLATVALVLIVLALPPVRRAFGALQAFQAQTAALGVTGVALCVAGAVLAVLARVHLGRNWGMPISRKENPELVTSGPYAYVRHPIYGGMMLAMLGTAIGASFFWVVPLVLFGGYFVFSARREEEIMLAQFPVQYRAYMQRTWMLLPYVL